MGRNNKRVALVIGNGTFIIAACLAFGLILLTWTADVALAAEQKKAEAAAHPGEVAVMVRAGNGRDEEQWFTPGAGNTESFQDCIDSTCNIKGPEMVVVPKGSFIMGSNDGEVHEKPEHRVTIGEPFAVGKFEVTWDEWDACVADGGCDNGPVEIAGGDRGWGRGNRPMINVNWHDAKSYVKWLSAKTGKKYRLLSEAEWEYAARAGTTTRYWWGSSICTDQANYNGNYTYESGCKGKYRKKTVPVKSFQPNPWGLYQVHGNVWEWCEDNWHSFYDGAPDDGSAWTDGQWVAERVLRGGAWGSIPGSVGSATRDCKHFFTRYEQFGFRVARKLTP